MGAPYNIVQEWLKLGLDDSFMDDGACKEKSLEVRRGFFADTWRGIRGQLALAESKRICTFECEVNVECLEYALAAQIDDGIWGGTTPEERRAIRDRRASATDESPSPSSASPGPSTTNEQWAKTDGAPLSIVS